MKTVYRIYNTETNKSYIGVTTKTAEQGLKDWFRNCGRTKYKDYDIVKDFKQYGKQSFKSEFIKSFEDPSEAKEYADQQIDLYNCIQPNGYNLNYTGIRKLNPDYYERRNIDTTIDIRSTDKDIGVGEKSFLEQEMASLYGIENLVQPDKDSENYATPEIIDGLRQLADDLEKYGNIDVVSFIPKKLNDELNANGKKIKKLLDGRVPDDSKKKYTIISEDNCICERCGKCKTRDQDFYKHFEESATYDGVIHICKDCLAKLCKRTYDICQNPLFVIMSLCQLMNIIFVQEIAEKAAEQWTRNKDYVENIIKYYISEMRFDWLKRRDTPRIALEFRNSHFIGDIFGYEEYNPQTPKVFIKELNGAIVKEKAKNDKTIAEELEQKWGKGFKAAEYQQLEEEYTKLEKFLSKKTDLHIEALKKYIIYNFKEKSALANGKDLKEIKEWSQLADKAAESAQLKIKQLSADFGEGVDSFAQLAETVEEYFSVIPTLPKTRKIPYDDSDFLIWQNVNYIRRLEGKPEVSYGEVYQFYDDELTKKMRDSGMDDDQIKKAKEERNGIFKDLSDNYQEPLWILPVIDAGDDDDEDEGGGL